MLHIHANHEYNVRETLTWAKLQDAIERHDRNYFAGHCLDAIELMPSGAMQRIEPAVDTSHRTFRRVDPCIPSVIATTRDHHEQSRFRQ
ncbi:hypothetical protein DO62_1063 [Burkholderia pseudomallei]|nr:hypothetical protein DO62_1063 [Burkholderia pseudomallei]